jgi:hypothetical protein
MDRLRIRRTVIASDFVYVLIKELRRSYHVCRTSDTVSHFVRREKTMQSGSTQGSTDGSTEKAPTSACVGNAGQQGSAGLEISWSAGRQILPILYACLRSGGLQNREIPPICARLRIAGLQIREALFIHARLLNGRLPNNYFSCVLVWELEWATCLKWKI